MYAGIMGGMREQRKENTTNRRESSRLFNEYLKSSRELGIDLTEEDLTNQWNNNSSAINRQYAPSKSRMQGIIQAQADHNQQQDQLEAFQQLQRDQQIDDMLSKRVTEAFRTNAYTEGDSSAIHDILSGQFAESELLSNAYGAKYNNGLGLGMAHKTYENDQSMLMLDKVQKLIAAGVTDPDAIRSRFTDAPQHLISGALTQAKTLKERADKTWSDSQHASMMQNRNNAMQEISKKVALGDINPEDVQHVMERWNLTEPEDQQYIMDHFQLESQVQEQAAMEAANTKIEQRQAKAQVDNAATIKQMRTTNKEMVVANFKEMSLDIRGAVEALSNKYAIDSSVAQGIVDHINKNLASDPDHYKTSRRAITGDLTTYLSTQGVRTYANMRSELDMQTSKRIGSKQYTPKTFENVYIKDFEYDANEYISRMQRASDSGNLAAFQQAKGEFVAVLNETRHDLSIRQSTQKQSFGSYASTEDVATLINLANEKIKEFGDAATAIPEPEEKVVEMDAGTKATVSKYQKLLDDKQLQLDEFIAKWGDHKIKPSGVQFQMTQLSEEIEGLESAIASVKP